MRIEKITFKNYRQYKDIIIDFSNKSTFDLHLILGENGLGKTNLLNGICWCFYGSEPNLTTDSKKLSILNLDTLKAHSPGDFCLVEVEIEISDKNQTLIFNRIRRLRIAEIGMLPFEYKDDFRVSIISENGDTIIKTNEEDTNSYVKKYLPESICEYFFFDGERLDSYFKTNLGTKVKQSIYEISQVQLLLTILNHIDIVIKDLRTELGKKNNNLSDLNNQQELLEKKIEKDNETVEKLKEQIQVSTNIINEKSEFLKGQDDVSDLENRLIIVKNKINESKNLLQKNELDICNFIKEYRVLLTFYPSIIKSLKIIEDKEKEGLLPPNIDKYFLEKMLNESRCLICDRPLGEVEALQIEKILAHIKVSSKSSHLLVGLKKDLTYKLNKISNYTVIRNKLLNDKKKNEKELEQNILEENNLSKKLSNYTNKDEIKNAHNERNQHEILKEHNTKKLGSLESQQKFNSSELEKVKEKIKTALSVMKEQQKLRQTLDNLGNINKIINSIKDEMVEEVRYEIQEKTTEIFKSITWKKNTYDKIIINDNYRIDLIHIDGYSCIGSCSAAERALLALSFTLALHQVSGFESCLVIDTPVSRISGDNRLRFAETLREISKNKQIIMFFTKSEYSEEIRDTFEAYTSTMAKLETLDERCTYIK